MEVDPTPLNCDPLFKIGQLGLVPASKDPVARGRARANGSDNGEMREKVVFGRGEVALHLFPSIKEVEEPEGLNRKEAMWYLRELSPPKLSPVRFFLFIHL